MVTDLTDAEWDALYERAKAGESVVRIASSMGRDKTAVYRMFARRYGYRARDFRRQVWAPTLTMTTVSTDLAYIAGIIDGEGSIMRNPQGLWIVRVNMTDRPLIEWLYSFGGKFAFRGVPKAHPNHKPQYEWMVARQLDVVTLLEAILPYMRVKSERAKQALGELVALDPAMSAGRLGQHFTTPT